MSRSVAIFLVLMFSFSLSSCSIFKKRIRKQVLEAAEKAAPDNVTVEWAESYRYPDDIQAIQPESNGSAVKGLAEHLEGCTDNEVLSVIMVHGMSTKEITDFDELVALCDTNFMARAGKEGADYEILGSRVWELPVVPGDTSGCTNVKVNLRRYSRGGITKYVNYVFVHWSPATVPYKNQVRAADILDTTQRYAAFNRLGKDFVVTDGLGDVAALVDIHNRRKAHRALEAAMLFQALPADTLVRVVTEGIRKSSPPFVTRLAAPEVLDIAHPRPSKVVFISGSLGTKLTMDFLCSYHHVLEEQHFIGATTASQDIVELQHETYPLIFNAGDTLVKQLKGQLLTEPISWISMSNQLPLLSALNFSVDYLFPGQDHYAFLAQSEVEQATLLDRTDMVSFFDPNDILGFRSRRISISSTAEPRTQILVRIPVAAGINLETVNPLDAHSGIKTHPYFGHILVNGWDLNPASLPKPEEVIGKVNQAGWLDGLQGKLK